MPHGLMIVVTGGPGSGKTTLVEEMAKLGYATAPEAAIQVIAELNERLGVDEQKVWRREHRTEFQLSILRRQVEIEERLLEEAPEVAFLDRGRLDGLAYCRFFGEPVPEELARLAPQGRYDRVLLLDTLSRFEDRAATGRTSDRAQSIALQGALAEVYREAGFEPLTVPELPVPERVRFVLDALGLG